MRDDKILYGIVVQHSVFFIIIRLQSFKISLNDYNGLGRIVSFTYTYTLENISIYDIYVYIPFTVPINNVSDKIMSLFLFNFFTIK